MYQKSLEESLQICEQLMKDHTIDKRFEFIVSSMRTLKDPKVVAVTVNLKLKKKNAQRLQNSCNIDV